MIFVISDEAYFTLTQPMNKQKNRILTDSQPAIGIETALHGENFKKLKKRCSLVLIADGGHIEAN